MCRVLIEVSLHRHESSVLTESSVIRLNSVSSSLLLVGLKVPTLLIPWLVFLAPSASVLSHLISINYQAWSKVPP